MYTQKVTVFTPHCVGKGVIKINDEGGYLAAEASTLDGKILLRVAARRTAALASSTSTTGKRDSK